jgi:hypothetical protein
MRLFYHFATQYDGHHLDRIAFKKRYDDVCTEWLGGLTVLKHRSKILAEQLGTHLEQLVTLGFLQSYTLTPAESRGGFVLTFRPGNQFRADYETFYARRSSKEIRLTFHAESREIGDPHLITYLFMEKRRGRKPDSSAFVSSKDVQTAKDLLAHLDMDQIPDFLDYALAEAGKTRFELQSVGGVRQYLQGYLETLERRRSGKAAAEARRAEEHQTQLRVEYDQYRRHEARRLMDSLPATEQASIEALARAKLSAGGPTPAYMAETLIRVEKVRLIIERHPNRIATFEQWSASRSA